MAFESSAFWDLLTKDEKETIITELKAEIAAELRSKESVWVPTKPDGSLDTEFAYIAEQLADPGTTTLSQYAGQLMAGEYQSAMTATADWAGAKVLGSFRDNALARLPEDSAARIYMQYLSEKPDLWKQIGKLVVSDQPWSYVASQSWDLFYKAMEKDLTKKGQEFAEQSAEAILLEMFGKWASAGYMAFLKAEVAYIREAEKLAAKVSLDNYYQHYYQLRQGGVGEDEAWSQTSDYLIGESGLPSLLKILQGGSLRELRIGGNFSAKADDLPRIRAEFNQCYSIYATRCLLETVSYFDEQWKEQEEQRNQRKKKSEEELAADIKKAGGFTRTDLRSVYSHLAERLRKKAQAAYRATEGEQQELAQVRYELDLILQKLERALAGMSGFAGRSTSILSVLEAHVQASVAASAQAEQLDQLAVLCAQEKGRRTSNDPSKIFRALNAKLEDLKNASNTTCDFGTPQSQTEAEQNLRRVENANQNTISIANAARNLLARLAFAAENQEASTSAASNLEAALNELEGVTAFADKRAALAELNKLLQQANAITDFAEAEYSRLRSLSDRWLGDQGIFEMVDRASRIMGTEPPHMELDATISQYLARVGANAARGKSVADPHRFEDERFEILLEQVRSRYASCKAGPEELSVTPQQVAEVEEQIETELWAADLCLQQARQVADPFDTNPSRTDSSSDTNSSAPAGTTGWGGGSMVGGNSNSGNQGWGGGSIQTCVTPPHLQQAVSAAIGQLQAAVQQPDRYAAQLDAIQNLVDKANHPEVCPEVKSQIRATLAELRNAQDQELAAAQEINQRAVAQGKAELERRRQSWARVASGLATALQTLQRETSTNTAVNSGSPTGYTGTQSDRTSNPNSTPTSDSSNTQCQSINQQLNQAVGQWQRLATQRPSKDQATQWCNNVKRQHATLTSLMRRAEQAGCTSIPKGVLSQSSQIAQTNCSE